METLGFEVYEQSLRVLFMNHRDISVILFNLDCGTQTWVVVCIFYHASIVVVKS